MKRVCRNLLAFFFGVALIALPMFANAESQPATYGYVQANWFWQVSYITNGIKYASCGEAAQASVAGNPDYPTASCGTCSGSRPYKSCQRYATHINGSTSYYGSLEEHCDGTWDAALSICTTGQQAYSCPSTGGWTLSGSTCTRPDCGTGTTRDSNGQCVPLYKTCAALVVTSTGSCVKSVPCGADSTLPLESALMNAAICSDQKSDPTNCAASGGIVIGEFQGKAICLSPPPSDPSCTALGGTVTGTLNGQPICSQATNNPPCPGGGASQGTINGQPVCNGNCPTGSAPGTVNGVTSCYPVSPTTTKSTTQKSSSSPSSTTTTSNDPNVTPGQDTKSSTTQCEGERCTTTTTTTKCPEGQQCTTTTSTKGEDKGDYCKENPKASVCTGETEAEKFCKDNPDAVSCMKAGTPGDESGLTSVEKGISSITPVSVASSGGCPGDVQLPHGAVFSYAPACQFAEGLRPVILACAWLVAGLIVLGMTRNT